MWPGTKINAPWDRHRLTGALSWERQFIPKRHTEYTIMTMHLSYVINVHKAHVTAAHRKLALMGEPV